MHPPLSRYIESIQGERPWGSLLDAGTGVQSIRWIADLETERWSAISASPSHAKKVRTAISHRQRPEDKIIVGNWLAPKLLEGETFDTVIADYLLGAVEGFSPYFQSFLFKRLRPLTGKVIYVKGLEPYVPIPRPESEAGQIIWEIGRHRDACVSLGGALPYREYPAQWAAHHLQISGYSVREVKHFDTRYKAKFVNAQIDISVPALKNVPDRALAGALKLRGEALRERALDYIKANGALEFGQNYVIMAEPV